MKFWSIEMFFVFLLCGTGSKGGSSNLFGRSIELCWKLRRVLSTLFWGLGCLSGKDFGKFWSEKAIESIKCLMPLGRYSGWVWESYVCIWGGCRTIRPILLVAGHLAWQCPNAANTEHRNSHDSSNIINHPEFRVLETKMSYISKSGTLK